MRPLHLKLAATALLAVAALLMPRQSAPLVAPAPAPGMADHSMPSRRPGGPAASSPRRDTPSVTARTADRAPAADSFTPSTADRLDPSAMPTPDAEANERGLAVQLAENVQLPAALMTWAGTDGEDPAILSPAVAGVTREIGNTFYQNIAANSAASPVIPPAEPQPSQAAVAEIAVVKTTDAAVAATGQNDTIMIEPGPTVERARDIANETYRAMFGDQAYNQQTLNSALEVRLPVPAASGQH